MAKKLSNKKESKESNTKKHNQFPWAKLLLSGFVGLSSFVVYQLLSRQPPVPHIDVDQWWGPVPIDKDPDVSIRPYKIEFSDVMVNDLRERLLHRRPFTPPLEDIGFQYGFNTNFLTRVLDFWQNKYNFKEREQFFNKYLHYVTNIQGLDIHYMHIVPSVSSDITVVPLLMLHGWPGSIREFYEIIPKLTTPRTEQNFVFEIIAPSLPGFGFSQASVRPGLGAVETAVIMRNLMHRIGHSKYYVQGGDWGHLIGSNMATLFPESVLGFHTNCPVLLNRPYSTIYYLLGYIWPSVVLSSAEYNRMYPLSEHAAFLLEETGYMHLQATKPDTVGIALTDSPAGLASYILEKFSTWTNKANRRSGDGNLLTKYSLTHLLDNIMIYWSTNCITTSMRMYAESFNKRAVSLWMDEIPTEVPTWGIKFKHEIMYQPDGVLRAKYKNYLRSTVVEDGGHFAAFENPDILADDIFEAVDTFRHFHKAKSNQQELPRSTPDKQKAQPAEEPKNDFTTPTTVYDFTVKDLKGRNVKLNQYRGHVLLIVNVASYCGLTDKNYQELNQLYDKYATKGLFILAFPCNQFGGQEPGTNEEILEFARQRGVKFDIFEKIEVNGPNTHPLWQFLKRTQSGTFGEFIKWNFSKFIIDKNGIPVERFGPNVDPMALEKYLIRYL